MYGSTHEKMQVCTIRCICFCYVIIIDKSKWTWTGFEEIQMNRQEIKEHFRDHSNNTWKLAHFRPIPPPWVIEWHWPSPFPMGPTVTWNFKFTKNKLFSGFWCRKMYFFFPKTVQKGYKISRDTLVNPYTPPCVIWWHCHTVAVPPPSRASRII
jgi:hypothetical protein